MATNYFHVAAMAGAGCGKTYSLVENYLCAVLGFDESRTKKRPQIIALTFTDKAAREMRLRITKRLQMLISDASGDDALVQLSLNSDMPMPSKEELQRLLRALPTATIATFHSFCSQLLKREAAAFGIDDRFSILSPKEELFMAHNILRPLIIKEVEKNNRSIKSLVARIGLAANKSSLGLLDGLMDIYSKLFEKNIASDQLLISTTKTRVTVDMLWSSFHAIEVALARFFASDPSEKARARLDHIATAQSEVGRALKDLHEATIARAFVQLRQAAGGNFGDKEIRGQLVVAIANLGNRLVDFFVRADECEIASLLERFHSEFTEHKSAALVLSYSDLLLKTKETLISDSSLRQRVKAHTKHILVDEYQDTSPIQQDIIALLAEDRSHALKLAREQTAIDAVSFTNGPSLFVVGDKKQSIYGFRGASVALFDRMIDKMAETHATTELFSKRLLVTNRRSTRSIITLVNLVARHTMCTQGYDVDQALATLPNVDEGHCGLWVAADDAEMDKTTSNCTTAVFGVAKLLAERPQLKASDIVVLVRRIKSAAIIKRKLSTYGIDARVIGGDGFFQQQEIADLLSALKLINDPGDHLACGVVMRSPLVLLADDEIIDCALMSECGLTMAALAAHVQSLRSDSRNRLEKFMSALNEAAHVMHRDGLARALDIIIDHCDAAYAYGLHDNCEQIWANIEKLRTMLLMKTGNSASIIDSLYDELSSQSREAQAEPRAVGDAVTIMTIHQSKGLEFKVVVLADGESASINNFGDFLVSGAAGLAVRPRGRAIALCASHDHDDAEPTRYERMRCDQKRHEDDEIARLLYVALTRAREELYVACSKTSFLAKTLAHNLVGLFLLAEREAPDEFAACCTVETLAAPALPPRASEPETFVAEIATPVVMPIKMTRWFASALHCEDGALDTLIKRPRPSLFQNVNGDAAHRLLSWLCPLLNNNLDSLTERYLLNAAMRAEGLRLDDSDGETLEAVMTTACTLKAHLKDAERIISELPLHCSPTSRLMIEGFADLVIEHHDFIGVIEFKSSYGRAIDKNTYAQVLAYAEALAQNTTKSVKYAVILVGSPAWQWQVYTDKERAMFVRAISL